jgi:hypothetical protein
MLSAPLFDPSGVCSGVERCRLEFGRWVAIRPRRVIGRKKNVHGRTKVPYAKAPLCRSLNRPPSGLHVPDESAPRPEPESS